MSNLVLPPRKSNAMLSAGIGIATGISTAIANLYHVKQAKQNLEQGKEKFDIDKKIADLKLKQFELDPNFDPGIALQKKDLLDKQYKEANALYDLKTSMIDATTKGEKEKLKVLTDQYNIMHSFTLGAASQKINIDEQVKRKVATGGLASLTAGEKELWARMEKKNNSFVDAMNNDNPGSDMPGTVPAGAKATEGKSDWWNQ